MRLDQLEGEFERLKDVLRRHSEMMLQLRDWIGDLSVRIDCNTGRLEDIKLKQAEAQPKKEEIQYDPELHEIIGVCKTSEQKCKNCVAITEGTAFRKCRYAFGRYRGHLQMKAI